MDTYDRDERWKMTAGDGVIADEGRRRRFEELIEAHRIDIASYCYWRASALAEAEDALADVFLVAWRRLPDIPPGEGARAWLYAAARRVLANQRRAGMRRDALRERLAREPKLGSSAVDETSAWEVAVHEALARLADHGREVLLLVEWEGLDTAELAEVLDCGRVTARGRLHRARRRFRDLYHSLPQQPQERRSDQPTALTTNESHP